MKIVLLRRKNSSLAGGSFGNQDAESYMRVVFAHVSHKIWIQSVEVSSVQGGGLFGGSQEQIVVTCKPQGGSQEDDKLAKAAIEAISLRGDLELVKILMAAPTKEFDAIKQLDEKNISLVHIFLNF